jgi:hypothetical protein
MKNQTTNSVKYIVYKDHTSSIGGASIVDSTADSLSLLNIILKTPIVINRTTKVKRIIPSKPGEHTTTQK